ncbi:(3R)-hydroxymyristoyl ACP dehydratase [Candidatus Ishikawaella capsulata Mpkobe]|uniref:(3R)-hydroxymyristoyl ACP dehydratase n=1 Tax=Candidatus Ishikawaella capsulata Mpkobe TaxID=476281 RepID=C5WCK2_9ENTR|nr:(3R)-hydroxymyristoyl ACP dehydratase [Candidatus Ishikawaella capsulata Mpkobe]
MKINEIHQLKIEDILPHRYPFLFIDRVLEFKKNKYICALKNISMNEQIFQGHFPKKKFFQGY